jgi:TldD protein
MKDEEINFFSTNDFSEENVYSIKNKMNEFLNEKSSPSIKGFAKGTYYNEELKQDNVKERIQLLQEIDSYIRSNLSVENVMLRQICTDSDVWIYSKNGLVNDKRPLFSLSISVVFNRNGHLDNSYVSFSKRDFYSEIHKNWKNLANEIIRKTKVLLQAKPLNGKRMPVILGPGIPATLLHEAVGHGLEADFNSKEVSVFSNKIGKSVASSLVTVVDDGTIPNSRGSINFDDEGTESKRNILIENGILVSYMCDKLFGKKLNKESTGNGRRESFKHKPIPRMTNTILLNGKNDLNEMISSIDYGIMAMDFGSGQVDITSGQFAFSGSEVYLIENGKISYPVRGSTISGMGSNVMQNIIGVSNDFRMDPCGGTCGKNGQLVPVNLGQPSVLVKEMVVGSSE